VRGCLSQGVVILGLMALGALAFLGLRTPSSSTVLVPTLVVTAAAEMPCAWTWHTEPLPDVDAQIAAVIATNDALAASGVVVNAAAFGENCNSAAGTSFAAMQTDFTINFTGDLSDEALGNYLTDVLPIIAAIPLDTLPGPNPGYININVTHGTTQRSMRVRYVDAMTVANSGASGAALITALGGFQ